jgi:hypothetical protein
MKMDMHTTQATTALLRTANGVDTLETNSLCCAAAGIIAPLSATAEALIPHEKLRGAALADATLNAQEPALAQPVVGYTHVSEFTHTVPESKAGRRYWPVDLTNVRPEEWAAISPRHVAEFAGMTEVWLLLEAAQKRIAVLEQDKARLWDDTQALLIDSNVANEQLLEALIERDAFKSDAELLQFGLVAQWDEDLQNQLAEHVTHFNEVDPIDAADHHRIMLQILSIAKAQELWPIKAATEGDRS